MTDKPFAIDPEVTALLAVSGLTFGFAYFASLKRSVTLLTSGYGWIRPVAYGLGRFCAAAGFLFVAVNFGAAPLLAAFAGFLLARVVVLRQYGRPK